MEVSILGLLLGGGIYYEKYNGKNTENKKYLNNDTIETITVKKQSKKYKNKGTHKKKKKIEQTINAINENNMNNLSKYNQNDEVLNDRSNNIDDNVEYDITKDSYIKNTTQNMEYNYDNRKLNLFTGMKDLSVPKKEVKNEHINGQENIFGGQSYTSEYQTHLNKSMYIKSELPFSQTQVGPGLGLKPGETSIHGFHQDIREYELPKTIDELRPKSNPKISFKKPIVPGKSFINKRDGQLNITKYKKAVMFKNRPLERSKYHVEANSMRSKQILKNTNRKNNNGESVGHMVKGVSKSYTKKGILKTNRKQLDEMDNIRNIKTNNKFDTNRDSYNCVETKKEAQASKIFENKLYIGNLLKALIPTRHYDDVARQTVKETTINNEDKNILNLVGGEKNILRYDDVARQTVKETTIDFNDKNILNLKANNKITKRYYDPMKQTIRETTENNIHNVINMKLFNKLPKRSKQVIATTLKECLLHEPRLGNVDLNKKGYKIDIPKFKKTLKETLLHDSQLLNLIGTRKHKQYLMDQAKKTHKQSYCDNETIGQMGLKQNDGYKQQTYAMGDTNRQTTSDKDYIGIVNNTCENGYLSNKYEARETNKETISDNEYYGGSIGDKKHVSYSDIYNATINDLKETTLKNRMPTFEGTKIPTGADNINLHIKKEELITDRDLIKRTTVNNTVLPLNRIDENDETTLFLNEASKKKDSIDDQLISDRSGINNDIVKLIESNKLNISINDTN